MQELHSTDVDSARHTLFGPEHPDVTENLRSLQEVMRRSVFKGTNPRDVVDNVAIDRRLPFSESLGRACFAHEEDQATFERGELKDVTIQNLTPFGLAIREALKESTFVDLGCGGELSHLPKRTAHLFGAQYVGVDKYNGFVERVEQEGSKSIYLKGDILETLTRLGHGGIDSGHLVLFLSGIEFSRERALFPGDPTNAYNDRYAEECRREMDRIRPRAIIIGPGTSKDLHPDAAHFFKVSFQKVQSEVGEHPTGKYELWVPRKASEQHELPAPDTDCKSPLEWAT